MDDVHDDDDSDDGSDNDDSDNDGSDNDGSDDGVDDGSGSDDNVHHDDDEIGNHGDSFHGNDVILMLVIQCNDADDDGKTMMIVCGVCVNFSLLTLSTVLLRLKVMVVSFLL